MLTGARWLLQGDRLWGAKAGAGGPELGGCAYWSGRWTGSEVHVDRCVRESRGKLVFPDQQHVREGREVRAGPLLLT